MNQRIGVQFPDPVPLQELMEKYGKRCPKCKSGQISSDNSTPLNHKCLDCGNKFTDNEAIVGTEITRV